jgi:hypothetical protein
MLQKGAPIDWLQKQMGHRNLTMLIRHYWRWINPGELSQPSLLTTKKQLGVWDPGAFPVTESSVPSTPGSSRDRIAAPCLVRSN